jgi:GDP-L-fucose synthase
VTKRKILVCGATGFIGRNLVERLAGRDELEVHAVRFTHPPYDLAGVTWHQADLRRAEDVAALLDGFDVVIQAAATTSGAKDIVGRPHIHVTDNAVMNALLLRAAFENKVGSFVYFSCSVMYPSSDVPVAEDGWDEAQVMPAPYFGAAWTKIYGEKMCAFFAGLGTTRYTVIRHSNVYGPHDKFDLEQSHVFGATVAKCLSATDGRLSVWGSGEEARDLLYVGDLVDFVERVIDGPESPFEIYNVGAGTAVTINDLVARINAASGRDLTIEHDLGQPTIKSTVCLDCTKAHQRLGWSPRVSLDAGIAKTIDWWRTNHGQP